MLITHFRLRNKGNTENVGCKDCGENRLIVIDFSIAQERA